MGIGGSLSFNSGLFMIDWQLRYFLYDDANGLQGFIQCNAMANASWSGADGSHGSTGAVLPEPPSTETTCSGGERPEQSAEWFRRVDEELSALWLVPATDERPDWPLRDCVDGICTFDEFADAFDDEDSGAIVTHAVLVPESPFHEATEGLGDLALFGYLTQDIP